MNEFARYIQENKLNDEIDRVGVREAVQGMKDASDKECREFREFRKKTGSYRR